MIKYWKISLGEKGEVTDECIQKKIIAIGWHEAGNLVRLSEEKIKEKWEKINWPKTKGRKRDSPLAGQVIKFIRKMEKGDVVICYKKGTIQSIGKITSEAYYNLKKGPSHVRRIVSDEKRPTPTMRDVKWILIKKIKVKGVKKYEGLYKNLMRNDTLHEIKDESLIKKINKIIQEN